jgi:hypothetical protein
MKAERNRNALIVPMDLFLAMTRAGHFRRNRIAIALTCIFLDRHTNGTAGSGETSIALLVERPDSNRRRVKRAIRCLEESGWWQIDHGKGDIIKFALAKYALIKADRP